MAQIKEIHSIIYTFYYYTYSEWKIFSWLWNKTFFHIIKTKVSVFSQEWLKYVLISVIHKWRFLLFFSWRESVAIIAASEEFHQSFFTFLKSFDIIQRIKIIFYALISFTIIKYFKKSFCSNFNSKFWWASLSFYTLKIFWWLYEEFSHLPSIMMSFAVIWKYY